MHLHPAFESECVVLRLTAPLDLFGELHAIDAASKFDDLQFRVSTNPSVVRGSLETPQTCRSMIALMHAGDVQDCVRGRRRIDW